MRITASLALAVGVCLPLAAQDYTPRFEVGAFGGGQFWKFHQSDKYPLERNMEPGGVFGGRFGYDFSPRLGFEVTGAYGTNKEGFVLQPGLGSNRLDFNLRNFQIMAGPMLYLRSYGARVRPYVTAGPALQYFWPTEEGRNAGLAAAQPLGPVRLENNVTAALHYGGGVKFWLTQKLNARLDVRGILSANPHIRYFYEPRSRPEFFWPSGGYGHGLQVTAGLGYSIGQPGYGELSPKLALTVEIAGPNKRVYQGDQVNFTASTNAPAGTAVKYSWRVDNQAAGSGESIIVETAGLNPGPHTVEVTASAPKLGNARDSVSFDVLQANARELSFQITGPENRLFVGDPASFSAKSGVDGVSYNWMLDGKPIGSGESVAVMTKNMTPGTYKVEATASAQGYKSSTREATLALLEPQPPQIRLSAPGEVTFPEKAPITVSATPGEGGGTLGPIRLSASDGTIQDRQLDTSTVQFDQSIPGAQRKVVNLTASVTDSKGLSASTTGSVTVVRKVTAEATRLPDVVFPRDNARVNNCGKRVLLEELRGYIDRDPTGRVILLAHMDKGEIKTIAERRGKNAAAAITAGSGICLGINPRQVLIGIAGTSQTNEPMPFLCGTSTREKAVTKRGKVVRMGADTRAPYRRVEVWFVPTGAELPQGMGRLRTAAAYNVSTLGCPR